MVAQLPFFYRLSENVCECVRMGALKLFCEQGRLGPEAKREIVVLI
jgi:hypothetical protein